MSPGVPLNGRLAVIANHYRWTPMFKSMGRTWAKDGELLHLNPQSRQNPQSAPKGSLLASSEPLSTRIVALRIDFVAKPGQSEELETTVGELLAEAELYREGLQSSMLLVSDREARLVTLLTMWDAERFDRSRERLTAWTQKLIAGITDGPIRTYTSKAHFLSPRATSKLTLADLRPEEIAELVDMASGH